MEQWLLKRLFNTKDQPVPRFAFQGTVNWMRALSILLDGGQFIPQNIQSHYSKVNRRKPNYEADTLVFENMMMAYHNQSALFQLNKNTDNPYDSCRSAIINWYYSTYFTCSAMVAAASGSKQETHASTAKVWHADIVKPGLLLKPFSLHLNSLVSNEADSEISAYRNGNRFTNDTRPETEEEAWGAAIAYLSGTQGYEKWKVEERLKNSKEFKSLGVSNFRTKVARELRDKYLAKNEVNYLVQAFRYRGKANYRDSIFLSYGNDNTDKISTFISDLEKVSFYFQCMAAEYLKRRVERDTWDKFVEDLENNSMLSLDPNYLIS